MSRPPSVSTATSSRQPTPVHGNASVTSSVFTGSRVFSEAGSSTPNSSIINDSPEKDTWMIHHKQLQLQGLATEADNVMERLREAAVSITPSLDERRLSPGLLEKRFAHHRKLMERQALPSHATKEEGFWDESKTFYAEFDTLAQEVVKRVVVSSFASNKKFVKNKELVTELDDSSCVDIESAAFVHVWACRREARRYQSALRAVAQAKRDFAIPNPIHVPYSVCVVHQCAMVTVTWLPPLQTQEAVVCEEQSIGAAASCFVEGALGNHPTRGSLALYPGADGALYVCDVSMILGTSLVTGASVPTDRSVNRRYEGLFDEKISRAKHRHEGGASSPDATNASDPGMAISEAVERLTSVMRSPQKFKEVTFQQLSKGLKFAGVNTQLYLVLTENETYKFPVDPASKQMLDRFVYTQVIARSMRSLVEASIAQNVDPEQDPAAVNDQVIRIAKDTLKKMLKKTFLQYNLMPIVRKKFATHPQKVITHDMLSLSGVFTMAGEKLGLQYSGKEVSGFAAAATVMSTTAPMDLTNAPIGNPVDEKNRIADYCKATFPNDPGLQLAISQRALGMSVPYRPKVIRGAFQEVRQLLGDLKEKPAHGAYYALHLASINDNKTFFDTNKICGEQEINSLSRMAGLPTNADATSATYLSSRGRTLVATLKAPENDPQRIQCGHAVVLVAKSESHLASVQCDEGSASAGGTKDMRWEDGLQYFDTVAGRIGHAKALLLLQRALLTYPIPVSDYPLACKIFLRTVLFLLPRDRQQFSPMLKSGDDTETLLKFIPLVRQNARTLFPDPSTLSTSTSFQVGDDDDVPVENPTTSDALKMLCYTVFVLIAAVQRIRKNLPGSEAEDAEETIHNALNRLEGLSDLTHKLHKSVNVTPLGFFNASSIDVNLLEIVERETRQKNDFVQDFVAVAKLIISHEDLLTRNDERGRLRKEIYACICDLMRYLPETSDTPQIREVVDEEYRTGIEAERAQRVAAEMAALEEGEAIEQRNRSDQAMEQSALKMLQMQASVRKQEQSQSGNPPAQSTGGADGDPGALSIRSNHGDRGAEGQQAPDSSGQQSPQQQNQQSGRSNSPQEASLNNKTLGKLTVDEMLSLEGLDDLVSQASVEELLESRVLLRDEEKFLARELELEEAWGASEGSRDPEAEEAIQKKRTRLQKVSRLVGKLAVAIRKIRGDDYVFDDEVEEQQKKEREAAAAAEAAAKPAAEKEQSASRKGAPGSPSKKGNRESTSASGSVASSSRSASHAKLPKKLKPKAGGAADGKQKGSATSSNAASPTSAKSGANEKSQRSGNAERGRRPQHASGDASADNLESTARSVSEQRMDDIASLSATARSLNKTQRAAEAAKHQERMKELQAEINALKAATSGGATASARGRPYRPAARSDPSEQVDGDEPEANKSPRLTEGNLNAAGYSETNPLEIGEETSGSYSATYTTQDFSESSGVYGNGRLRRYKSRGFTNDNPEDEERALSAAEIAKRRAKERRKKERERKAREEREQLAEKEAEEKQKRLREEQLRAKKRQQNDIAVSGMRKNSLRNRDSSLLRTSDMSSERSSVSPQRTTSSHFTHSRQQREKEQQHQYSPPRVYQSTNDDEEQPYRYAEPMSSDDGGDNNTDVASNNTSPSHARPNDDDSVSPKWTFATQPQGDHDDEADSIGPMSPITRDSVDVANSSVTESDVETIAAANARASMAVQEQWWRSQLDEFSLRAKIQREGIQELWEILARFARDRDSLTVQQLKHQLRQTKPVDLSTSAGGEQSAEMQQSLVAWQRQELKDAKERLEQNRRAIADEMEADLEQMQDTAKSERQVLRTRVDDEIRAIRNASEAEHAAALERIRERLRKERSNADVWAARRERERRDQQARLAEEQHRLSRQMAKERAEKYAKNAVAVTKRRKDEYSSYISGRRDRRVNNLIFTESKARQAERSMRNVESDSIGLRERAVIAERNRLLRLKIENTTMKDRSAVEKSEAEGRLLLTRQLAIIVAAETEEEIHQTMNGRRSPSASQSEKHAGRGDDVDSSYGANDGISPTQMRSMNQHDRRQSVMRSGSAWDLRGFNEIVSEAVPGDESASPTRHHRHGSVPSLGANARSPPEEPIERSNSADPTSTSGRNRHNNHHHSRPQSLPPLHQ